MNILELKEKLLTPTEVGKKLGVTSETVRTWIASRKIRAMRVGGRWKIPASALDFAETTVANPSEEEKRRLRRAAEIASARNNIEKILIIARKPGEAVKIGESIVRVQKATGVIKLSIDAPETIRIEREEMIKPQKARKKCQD